MTIEGAAEAARRSLGIGLDGPVPDLLRMVEDEAGLFVFIVPLGDDGVEGAFQRVDGDPFVLLNQDKAPVRKRFTLAHEFAHFFLNHGAQLDQKISFQSSSLSEREANGLAASLLAPRQAIDHWLARHDDPKVELETIVRMAFFFNVSAFVIRYRLENIGRLGRSQAVRMDEAIRSGSHHQLAVELGLKRPLDSIATQHFRGGYVPAAMQAKISDLLRRELLTREAAIALLRVSDSAAIEQLGETMDANDLRVE